MEFKGGVLESGGSVSGGVHDDFFYGGLWRGNDDDIMGIV